MSVLPKNSTDAENKYYVIRVKKRTVTPAPLNAEDAFTTLGCLHVDNDGNLDIHNQDAITLNVSSNFDHVWNIYALDDATDGEHSRLIIKNTKSGKYISNSTASATHLTSKIAVNVETDNAANYFTMKPYADHFAHRKIVSKAEYDNASGTEGTDKGTDVVGGKTEYWVLEHEDRYDFSKHYMYLNGTDFKVHADGSNGNYHITMASNTGAASSSTVHFNDYANDGNKDDIIFEIVEVEVADATNTVTYKFNVKDEKGSDLYHFYLQNNHVDEFNALTAETVANYFQTELTYYKDFTNLQKPSNTAGYHNVEIDCKPNFPFLLSEEIRSFDSADLTNQRLNFFTMSAGAPSANADGYYVGLENANYQNTNDQKKMVKHGHYDNSGTQQSDFQNYSGKFMSDFHRHVDGSLLWYACKAKEEINDPNAIRLYLFTTTTHPLIAPDAIHDSYTGSEYKGYGISTLEDGVDPSHGTCNHDVFVISPNTTTLTPNGFSLTLKSDNTLKLATSHTGTSEPEKTWFEIARGATIEQTRLNIQSGTDLVNIAVNSRGTRNVGGVDPDEFLWIEETMKWYRLAYMYPDGNYPSEYDDYKVMEDAINAFRLYALAYIFESYPDYTNFDIKKHYRIELYKEHTHEDANTSNKMLSSFESYMKKGATEIAGVGMDKPKTLESILHGENWSAADASTYWQIYPTGDKTPESGEEVEIAIYNPNVGAFLKKGTGSKAITFGPLCDFTEENAENATNADRFYVKQEGTSDQWVILDKLSTADEVSKLTINASGNFEWLVGYDHGTAIADYKYDNANQNHGRWMFSEIASYPLTISSVGWASLCLPYAVKFTDTNASVFYASEAGESTDENSGGKNKDLFSSHMTLTKIDEVDGVHYIPANTPVLISKTGGANLNLEVIDADATLPEIKVNNNEKAYNSENNLLTGVNAKWGHANLSEANGGIVDKEYYGLGNKDPKYGIAFYPIVNNPNPYLNPNKAFLTADNTKYEGQAGARPTAFIFSFTQEGTTTEINAVTGETTTRPADGIYYDLSGRRVNAPRKGIYVNAQGKKFIVK